MTAAVYILLGFLVICALAVSVTKDPLAAVLIQLGFSTVMAVIWLILESPDLAVTEAAVGTGVTGVLFFSAFRRIGLIGAKGAKKNETET